jgi:type II secretory pathway component GspD/PulD (secretin)
VIRNIVCVLAASLFIANGSAPAQSIGKDARVNLRVEGRELSAIVDYLREQSGANLVLLPGHNPKISLELSDVSWRDALSVAAEAAGCVVSVRTGGILVVEKPVPVTYETTEPVDITELINMIGKMASANIVVAPEVKGSISLRLTNVPWRDALDVAVKTLGYTVIEENRGILRVVDPVTLQAQMSTKSYQLRYIRPKSKFKPQIKSEFLQPITLVKTSGNEDIAKTFTVLEALRKALSGGGELDYVEAQNVVIVRDTDQVHGEIKSMLDRLDVEPAQVFVDVKFVSTLNNDILDLGVDYGDNGPRVVVGGGQIPTTLPFGLGGGDWEDVISVSELGHNAPVNDSVNALGALTVPDTVFGVLSFTGVNATLKMLQRDVKSEVIQAPKVIALDGVEATIFVGETIRYAEAKTEQGQAGGLSLSLTEAEGSPVDVGFQLLIVPHVVPGTNTLTMEVIPKETSLSGTGQSALAPAGFDVFTIGAGGQEGTIALPRTRSSTIVTTMLLESGQTAMIGGLTTEQDTETNSRVPFLSDIPLLGELFEHDKSERTRRSLLVFLTPHIVHTGTDTERVVQSELLRRRARLKDEVEAMMTPETKALYRKLKERADKQGGDDAEVGSGSKDD